jgi:hypothetical protein
MDKPTDPDPLVRLADRKPTDVCATLALGKAARALLEDDLSPSRFLAALIQAEHHGDAVAYLAHALPKPDAVLWATQCVRMVLGGDAPAEAAHALAAAEAWAMEPSLENSRAAGAAAVEMERDGGARFAALAACWSGESLAPPDLPPIPPPPGLTAAAVSGAIQIAAATGEAAAMPQRYREFLARGILIGRTPLPTRQSPAP